MNHEIFFENFELLVNAPNGVQKLRELILQLAVQGKLMPQDSDDEPASILLEKIRVTNKNLKKSLPKINNSDNLYEFPKLWECVRLGDILNIEYGKNLPKSKRNQSGKYPVYGSNGIVGYHDKFLIDKPTIIVGRKGSAGALNISSGPSWTTDVSYFINPPEGINLNFAFILLKSLKLETLGKGIKPGLNRNEVYQLFVPLPPLEEQKRIVTKVDQLMALCDELEARQQKKHEQRIHLNNAALDKLLTAPTPEEFAQYWQRICDNFDLLYDVPETVGQLRQAILQLAVQGKLVAQDEGDEPAAVLLEKIYIEKERLVKEKKLKKYKNLPPIDKNWMPFELPNGWIWGRFPELGEFGRGKSKHRPRNDPILYKDGKYPLVQTGDVARANGIIKTYTNLYNEVGLRQSRLWPKGTLCITIAANIADSAVLGFDACFPDSIVGFIPNPIIQVPKYFEYFVRTAKDNLENFAPSTAQKNINLGILEKVLIPLPPLAELSRIVVKVDHLMALCDELEAGLVQAQTEGAELMEAVVHHVLAT
jgi:type I restriction enzyme S subunit